MKRSHANLLAIYVPNSTYEAETTIDNPSCAIRTGIGAIDVNQGCFVTYYALTNLPSAYIDTPLFDNADEFNATIGSYAGASLSTGTSYVTYNYFHAYNETVSALLGGDAEHRGQIGVRIPSGCYNPLCVFGVDTTAKIHDGVIVPIIL